jgi:CRISPR type III-A-associated RAMP protein Csm4
VDRITGSAREGRLFVADETFYGPGREFDVWHKLDEGDGELLGRVTEWWRWIQRNGFGRRKSTGHGAFRIEGEGLVKAGAELPQVANPNGLVTLSAWVPKKDDPANVTYRTRVKRGKLAEVLALPSPWKKPLLMLKPGAVARLPAGESVREWYGGLVGDMHWPGKDVPDGERDVMKDIVQYGYAFPLPVHIEEGA